MAIHIITKQAITCSPRGQVAEPGRWQFCACFCRRGEQWRHDQGKMRDNTVARNAVRDVVADGVISPFLVWAKSHIL
ncbi:MAG: hypothetical protein HQL43_06480 [Alphaproteobacteria bacterium]|nr:hypothetical protein [Alphaproteobacteria bacterium]